MEVRLTVVMLPHLRLHVVFQSPRRPKAEYIPCSVAKKTKKKQVAMGGGQVIIIYLLSESFVVWRKTSEHILIRY